MSEEEHHLQCMRSESTSYFHILVVGNSLLAMFYFVNEMEKMNGYLLGVH